MIYFPKEPLALALGLAALTLPSLAHGQSVEDYNCAADNAPDWLAGALVDDYLSSVGIGEGTERPIDDAMAEAVEPCVSELKLSVSDLRAYSTFTLAQVMCPELRDRIDAEGIAVARLDDLLASDRLVAGQSVEALAFALTIQLESDFAELGTDDLGLRLASIYILLDLYEQAFLLEVGQ